MIKMSIKARLTSISLKYIYFFIFYFIFLRAIKVCRVNTVRVKQAYNKHVRSILLIPNLHAASVKKLHLQDWQPGFVGRMLGEGLFKFQSKTCKRI